MTTVFRNRMHQSAWRTKLAAISATCPIARLWCVAGLLCVFGQSQSAPLNNFRAPVNTDPKAEVIDQEFARTEVPTRLAITLSQGIVWRESKLVSLGQALATREQVSQVNDTLSHIPHLQIAPACEPIDRAHAQLLGLDRIYILTCDAQVDAATIADLLGCESLVFESVEPLAVGHADDDRSIPVSPTDEPLAPPNDDLFPLQYALENRGQEIWGTPGIAHADINAVRAWTITRGSSDVVIAVLDSGVSQSHPDLAGQLVAGRNFTSADPDDTDDAFVSHGTHIAGVIGALTNNHMGVAGLAPLCRIMPIRVIDRFGFTFEEWVANGIIYAADHGATVLNISIGFPSTTNLLRSAVTYAHAQGVVICASSGNIATDPIGFPARLPETIAVGATNNRDEVTGFTSPGPQMTIAAPGRDIYSTWDTNSLPNTYIRKSGTSFAVPYVVGAAALIRSVRPDLSPEQVRHALVETATDVGEPGWDQFSGSGRLNAHQALLKALSIVPAEREPWCRADLNGDFILDFTDIQIFLEAFSQQDAVADLVRDGQFDFFDIVAYIEMFERGCDRP